jgi:hypothetical protein
VAIWTEFGNGLNSPERSYLRSWFDAHVEESYRKLTKLMVGVFEGRSTKVQVLEELGRWVEDEVKKTMNKGIPPPNAPMTVERKGFDKGAVETGTLMGKITHVVKESGQR